MMYQLLKINVSISKKIGDLTFEITLVDKHTQNSGKSYVDHYIRYANLASSLVGSAND